MQPGRQLTCLAEIDVFVLAGGLGTRIRPVLGNKPKLLAPIDGRPYLEYLLDWLAYFGARRIVFGLGHRAEAIQSELDRLSCSDLTIVTVIEPEQLGTGGAIGYARNQLLSDPVMVINGDSFVDADLCAFAAAYRASGRLGSVLCTQVDSSAAYGRVNIDNNGNIENFAEKDAGATGPATINAGVYLLSTALLDMIAARGKSSIERDIFSRLKPGSLQAFGGAFEFIDIGTPESLERAAKTFRRIPKRNIG